MANKTTKDHEEIRRWTEERGGKPSHVKSTGSPEDIGILRIDFPGYGEDTGLETITWEAWFDKFDERNLALLFQDETAEGQRSNFNKIVSSETAREAETRPSRGTRARRGGSRAKRAPIKKAAVKKAASKKGAKRSASARKKATKRPTKRHAPRRTARSRTAGAKRTASRSDRSHSSGSRSSRKRSAAKKSSTRKRR